jgi:DNA-binding NtrC family response regulator
MAKPASASRARILVVDDAPTTLEVLQRNLEAQGYVVFTASGVSEATRILEAAPLDLVITDIKMPGVSGLDLVRHVHQNLEATEVIVVTGYASIGGAVEAVKIGAEEYLPKPFTDEELLAAVNRALDKVQMKRAAQARSHRAPQAPQGIIGESTSMRKVFDAIIKAGSTSATVLVTGESGTGKELVARAIHYGGARASAPFVPVACGAIPEGLLESELFGHVKGSFTGATGTRAGFFQTAQGGTLFLDEISETSLSMQVKLLRVLQDKQVWMIGASRSTQLDVRIVAATNKDLHDLVKKGLFRNDLYYRLNVIPIEIPPLRDRGDDVLLLAQHFARKFAKELGKAVPQFSPEALEVLKNFYWPGNVRELENVIQRLVVMSEEGPIEVTDLPPLMRFSALRGSGLERTLAEVEKEYVESVLASVRGNKTRAAEILGISRRTLREKLKERQDSHS